MEKSNQIAAYYFPNYHVDPRNEKNHGRGWTEWDLMKTATARFPGHYQPKIPLWGYEDEADPEVMAKKIAAAGQHGLDAFIFDWYWYEGPFLQRALDEGFLPAVAGSDFKFALMWANHDWTKMHPGSRHQPYPVEFPWSTSPNTIEYVWDYIIEKYLPHPSYWRVKGLPYFSIYSFNRFITQMGGVDGAAAVIEKLRAKARRAGLPGVHINAIWYDILDSDPYCSACPQSEWVTRIGINSYTSYNNVCIDKCWIKDFPRVDYLKVARHYDEVCRKAQRSLPAPYFPVVTMGWDSSPRTVQSEVYEAGLSYPYLPVMEPSPEKLTEALRLALECLEGRPAEERIMFINAWNEWTEGSYLEPDDRFGMGYLEAVKKMAYGAAKPQPCTA